MKYSRNNLTKKIDDLIKMTKDNDVNSFVVLSALQGARFAHQDDLLAKKVQEYVKLVLMPSVKKGN